MLCQAWHGWRLWGFWMRGRMAVARVAPQCFQIQFCNRESNRWTLWTLWNYEYHWITVSDFRKASPISTLWTVRSKAPLVHLDNLRWVGSQIQGCNVNVVSCMIDVGMEMDGTWTCLICLLCVLSLLAFFWASSLFNAFHSSHHLTSQRAQFGTVWHVFHFSEDKIFEFNAESANNHECSPPDANSLAKGAMWAVFVWRCMSQQFPNFWPVCFVRNWRTEYWCHADSG